MMGFVCRTRHQAGSDARRPIGQLLYSGRQWLVWTMAAGEQWRGTIASLCPGLSCVLARCGGSYTDKAEDDAARQGNFAARLQGLPPTVSSPGVLLFRQAGPLPPAKTVIASARPSASEPCLP
jgi:hypothetical protein